MFIPVGSNCNNTIQITGIMEKFKKFFRCVVVPLGVVAVFLLTTAQECKKDDDGNYVDNRQQLSSAFTEKWDIPLGEVKLKYNLTKYINDIRKSGQIPPDSDISLLGTYHNIYQTRTYINFFDLLPFNYEFNSNNFEAGPEARFIFSSIDYKGWIEKIYTAYDEQLCAHNTIMDAPYIKSNHIVEFSAKTSTTRNDVRISWNREYYIDGVGVDIKIDENGTIALPRGFVSTGTRGDNEVGVRVLETENYDIIPNTIPGTTLPGGCVPTIIDESPQVSNVLLQGVCRWGIVNNNIKWDIPSLATF